MIYLYNTDATKDRGDDERRGSMRLVSQVEGEREPPTSRNDSLGGVVAGVAGGGGGEPPEGGECRVGGGGGGCWGGRERDTPKGVERPGGGSTMEADDN